VSKFSVFLEKQYLDWMQKSGKRKTLNEFADFLGIKRPLLSLWLGGKREPSYETTQRLSNLLGIEIFDALELPKPDPTLHYVNRHWGDLPDDIQKKVAQEIARYTTEKAPGEE
jgi:transcriptional regulator with XRE-family HTH domain